MIALARCPQRLPWTAAFRLEAPRRFLFRPQLLKHV
jgi:hypothetical protein